MYTSINTDYRNDEHNWFEIESQIRSIAEAGFSHVQWIHDWYGEYLYSPSEMYQARDVLREYGLTARTLHGSEGGERGYYEKGYWIPAPQLRCVRIRKDYTSTNHYLRLAGVDLIKNRIDLCAIIGADTLVLHMQLPYMAFRKNPQDKIDYYNAVYRSFDELQGYARAAGVRIAQENLFYTPNDEAEEKFDRLFNRYPEDYMGLCYDSGHATLSWLDNYYFLLEKYNDRLFAVHLQDSDSIEPETLEKLRSICERIPEEGIKIVPPEWADRLGSLLGYDKHRLPWTGGVLDWERIARGVASAPRLHLPADFEVVYREDCGQEEAAWLREGREKSLRFHEMVNRYKGKPV
ncbi:MAG: sugar phosphate isomerase/epimerase [Spirochaetales bacterium]|jgi:sugar phosphate isomerase/epimerase|nr:sugar phosphate isomerase/epimerase [Spirochaetales bacterium]